MASFRAKTTTPTIQKVEQRRVLRVLAQGGLSIHGLGGMPVTVKLLFIAQALLYDVISAEKHKVKVRQINE
jgi:hypothetical protein